MLVALCSWCRIYRVNHQGDLTDAINRKCITGSIMLFQPPYKYFLMLHCFAVNFNQPQHQCLLDVYTVVWKDGFV